MATGVTETERKYDAPPGSTPPDLAGRAWKKASRPACRDWLR